MAPATENLTKRIIIEVSFGSQFQQDVAMRLLTELLSEWKDTIEHSHKENTITITQT